MGIGRGEREEIQEKYILEMNKEYYEEHYEILKPPGAEIIRSRMVGEDFKDDETHKSLMKSYRKHRDALRNYEYDRRHNFKHI